MEQEKSNVYLDDILSNNFMINYISLYDQMLGSYLQTHLDLLLPLKNKIIKVQKNWNKYNEAEERKRYNIMIEKGKLDINGEKAVERKFVKNTISKKPILIKLSY